MPLLQSHVDLCKRVLLVRRMLLQPQLFESL